MPYFVSPLPLACGTAVLFVLIGTAQATLFRMAGQSARPTTLAEFQFIYCCNASHLMEQGKPQEALQLLRGQSHQPIPLDESSSSRDYFSPAGKVLQLTHQMCREAKHAAQTGNSARAQAYLQECRVLGKRIRSIVQADPAYSLLVANFIEKAAAQTERKLHPQAAFATGGHGSDPLFRSTP